MKNISSKAAQVAHACYILSAIMVFYTLLSIFNIHQYIPVSYTHLDVYKRQM